MSDPESPLGGFGISPTIEERLRFAAKELRVRPQPLSAVIPALQQAADEIERRGTEIDVLRADATRYEAEIAQLKGDLKAMTDFADLWYFVTDKKPLEFEKIVNEWSPAQWLHQAHLLKERTKK